jgi:hypothetical protein
VVRFTSQEGVAARAEPSIAHTGSFAIVDTTLQFTLSVNAEIFEDRFEPD